MSIWYEQINHDNLGITASQSNWSLTIPAAALPQPGRPGENRDVHDTVLSISGKTGGGTDTTWADLNYFEIWCGGKMIMNPTFAQYRAWFKHNHPKNFDFGATPYDLPISFGDLRNSLNPVAWCRGGLPRNGNFSIKLVFTQTQSGTGQMIFGHVGFNAFDAADHVNKLTRQQLNLAAAAGAAPYDTNDKTADVEAEGRVTHIIIPYDGVKEWGPRPKGYATAIYKKRNRFLNHSGAAGTNSSVNHGSPMRGENMFTQAPTSGVDGPTDAITTGLHIEALPFPIALETGSKLEVRLDDNWDGASTEAVFVSQLDFGKSELSPRQNAALAPAAA